MTRESFFKNFRSFAYKLISRFVALPTTDMKNSVADRANAQVSCAGQFIANHMGSYLEDGGKWVHIDMAYCVNDKNERATGYGVALLYSMVQSIESSMST